MRFQDRRNLLLAPLLVVCASALLLAGCGDKKADSAQTTAQRVEATKTLRIGLEGTYPPFNFQDKDGQLAGYDVDFAKALAEQMGLKPEFQPAPFAGLLGALESRRIDVVINQITITPERAAKYDFSRPYTVSGIQIITLKGKAGPYTPAELAGKKVGVGLGTNYESWARQNAPTADVRTYDDDPTKYQDLKAGRIDAVLNDRLVAADFIKTSPEFVASGPPFAIQNQGVAMLKDPAMKVLVDQSIEELRKSGKLAAISQKWFGADVTQ